MKKIAVVVLAWVAFLVCGCQSDDQQPSAGNGKADIFMVVSANLDAGKLEEARRIVLHTLFEVMQGGDRLTVVEAGSRSDVAEFVYPEVDLRTARLKKKYVEKEWARFLSYCERAEAGGPGEADGRLDIPLAARFLADRLAVGRRGCTEVVFIGSPLHRDRNPEFSFGRDDWFSDGVFRHDTPFRVPEGGGERLKGVVFHLIYFDNPFADIKHQDRVHRFWALYVGLQGGSLVTFSSDSKAYRRIKTDIAAVRYELDPADARLVARHSVREAVLAQKATAPVAGQKLVISVRYENRAADVDLVAELSGQRLDFKTAAPFGMHKKHLVTGSEEIVTGLDKDLKIKLEHVNGPPPGKITVNIFSESGERLAAREYDGFQRWASYNLQKQEVSFKLAELLEGS